MKAGPFSCQEAVDHRFVREHDCRVVPSEVDPSAQDREARRNPEVAELKTCAVLVEVRERLRLRVRADVLAEWADFD